MSNTATVGESLIESGVQAALDAGLAVDGEHGVAPARHSARTIVHKVANWSEEEWAAINRLREELDLSTMAVLRCALRHYQADHERLKAGETVTWSGDAQRLADFAGPLATPMTSTTVGELVERVRCSHEAYQGFCCHCGVQIINGVAKTPRQADATQLEALLREVLLRCSMSQSMREEIRAALSNTGGHNG